MFGPTPSQPGPMMSAGAYGEDQPQPAGIRPDQHQQYNAVIEPQRVFEDGWEFVMDGAETQPPGNQSQGQQSSQGLVNQRARSSQFKREWDRSLRSRSERKNSCKNQ